LLQVYRGSTKLPPTRSPCYTSRCLRHLWTPVPYPSSLAHGPLSTSRSTPDCFTRFSRRSSRHGLNINFLTTFRFSIWCLGTMSPSSCYHMATSQFLLVAFLYAITATCSTIPPRTDSTQQPASTTSWSTEAILGLCAIFVALLCCIVGLAGPKYWQLLSRCSLTSSSFGLPSAKAITSTIGLTLHNIHDRHWWRLDAL
jgi:hypothetical protein